MNLYEKIAEVMKDIKYLAKDGNIEYKTTKYKAISEEKVTTAVRQSLLKHGLVIFPVDQEMSRTGNLTSVNVKYKIVNVEDPKESEILSSSGEGADTQDKGIGKAMTYAYKYMLLRTFAIPTGEDPDKISSDEMTDKINDEAAKIQKGKERITGVMVKALRGRFEDENVDEAKILEAYKIGKLEDMTMNMHDNLHQHFKKVKEMCGV
ncbi:MAG: ERF family protein [Lachnospiraceae bacterium]